MTKDDPDSANPGTQRLDKWLWASRMFKTRSLAADEIGKGRVLVNGQAAKASRDVRAGDRIEIRRQGYVQALAVLGLSAVRGPAPQARLLYAESEQSIVAREASLAARKLGTEPALAQPHGRPTKRDRRQMVDWQRWSASIDDT